MVCPVSIIYSVVRLLFSILLRETFVINYNARIIRGPTGYVTAKYEQDTTSKAPFSMQNTSIKILKLQFNNILKSLVYSPYRRSK